jgi:hypothetical protein
MDAEGWLTSELAAFACGACGQPYGSAHVRLIAQREELFFVDLACAHCGSQAVAIVTIQLDGDSATIEAGRLLPAGDISGTENEGGIDPCAPPISVDDVLDMHAFLEGYAGDVGDLLTRGEGRGR